MPHQQNVEPKNGWCFLVTRPHPKWWFSKGNPLISGKSRLVKYCNLARMLCKIFFFSISQVGTFSKGSMSVLRFAKTKSLSLVGIRTAAWLTPFPNYGGLPLVVNTTVPAYAMALSDSLARYASMIVEEVVRVVRVGQLDDVPLGMRNFSVGWFFSINLYIQKKVVDRSSFGFIFHPQGEVRHLLGWSGIKSYVVLVSW